LNDVLNGVADFIKRFSQIAGSDGQYKKNETRVKFPTTLDMTPYTPQAKRKESGASRKTSFVYELLSVIIHIGKMDTGHYISYSRDRNNQVNTPMPQRDVIVVVIVMLISL